MQKINKKSLINKIKKKNNNSKMVMIIVDALNYCEYKKIELQQLVLTTMIIVIFIVKLIFSVNVYTFL